MPTNNRAWLRLLVVCTSTWLAAYAARLLLVPDIAPIALAEWPHALWVVEVAFVLHAIELTAGFGVALLSIVGLRRLVYPRACTQTQRN